jgi:hypothetical protein
MFDVFSALHQSDIPCSKGERLLLAPKMNQSLWFHFVVDSMVIGSFLQFVLSSSSGKT